MTRADIQVNIIRRYIDLIWMALFASQVQDSRKSVSPLMQLLIKEHEKLRKLLMENNENEILLTVANKFEYVLNHLKMNLIQNKYEQIDQIFHSNTDIDLLLSTAEYDTSDIGNCAKMLLAICGQVPYEDICLVIPNISMRFNNDQSKSRCYSSLEKFSVGVDIKNNNDATKMTPDVRMIFDNMTMPDSVDKHLLLIDICQAMNIPFMPDISTGLGINRFLMIHLIATKGISYHLKHMTYDSSRIDTLINRGLINLDSDLDGDNSDINRAELHEAEPVIACNSRRSTIRIGLEAADDNMTGENADDASAGSTEEVPTKKETDPPANDDPPKEGDDQDTKGDEDPNAPDPGTDPEPDVDVDSNNEKAKEPHVEIFGIKFELAPSSETFSDIQYKIAVCGFISNVVTNQPELYDAATVTIMKKWKSLFLFIVSAKETKKLLSSLKVKFV